ncbi:hypothetical protein [Thalassotalea mangrovi]|uniref:PqqD family peptide modification chaperone n=1 Tax=Thalassotalea mangrovi TaxID=2572245 RepID=A0A4U1B3W8_9GAMM|nr:hypothetical protein [Thalassotalea mangrovi]TKB44660.1 hypothetical protein E8M12_11015 [Thalassotalea mangrovi]
MQHIPLNNTQLQLLVDGEQGLLFCHQRNTLHKLEPAGIALLLVMDAGVDKQQCIAQITNLSRQSVEDIESLYWLLSGLYHARFDADVDANLPPSNNEPLRQYRDSLYFEIAKRNAFRTDRCLASPQAKENCPEPELLWIRIAGLVFRLCCKHQRLRTELEQIFKPVSFLATDVAGCAEFAFEIKIGKHAPAISDAPDSESLQFEFYSQGKLIATELKFNQVAPVLIERIQILTYQASGFRFCFHGAALSENRKLLLLPGKSGAGKSTLTAYLAKRGFAVHSDEMIAFNDKFDALTIAMPIAIKRGAWAPLENEYPQLKHQPVWQLKDGRDVKYVWPDDDISQDTSTTFYSDCDSVYFIAPDFTTSTQLKSQAMPKEPVHSRQLTVIEMLELLIRGGYQVGHELSASDVKDLTNFMDSADRDVLSYCSSEQAFQYVKKILAEK